MSLWSYFDERARRLGILDTKLAQLAAICVGLIIVKLIPAIMRIDIWWFVLIAVIAAIKPLITFYGKSVPAE